MFVAWGASDWFLGDKQIQTNEQLRQDMLKSLSDGGDNDDDDASQAPILFYCVVRRSHGVSHCLTGAKVGDVVEVLDEAVGPEGVYNLCRLPAEKEDGVGADAIGWFPTRWLQKMDDYDLMLERQAQRLNRDGGGS
jgi:hypothetical protein